MSSTDANLALWARADEYHDSFLIKPDPILDSVQEKTKARGIDYEIAVSPAQGKFLHLLLLSINAQRVLEVVALELEDLHADVIEENVKAAGQTEKVRVVRGPALQSLEAMPDSTEKFDLAFIDADKENNTNYFIHAKRLVRKGGIIIVDNVGRRGRVADPASTDSSVEGVRALLRYIKDDPDVEATTIHTVGVKGFDGFLYAYNGKN
uniref:O-methyltransferase family 3 protein n=1 Tax=Mycena chlorophos TaxID=658473 RepID=A0ABQ0LBL6_MYCCL|nr:predicted protein [Mycena chlorophos]